MSAPCVAVAYSAGRDSTALLHATARQAALDGARVVALHVHHGLSPQADAWLAHAQAQCTGWAAAGLPVRLMHRHLEGQPAPGDSIEAWAREGRYRALRQMALEAGATLVLLAHHRRDQAETLLLQALRGAGVAGLSGMPREAKREGITWLRPWLDQPRETIELYIRTHALSHVEDDSNADPRFARNRLRLAVWPALTDTFAQAEAALAAAAGWAQEATSCLQELAALDLAHCSTEDGLRLTLWRQLSAPRRSNALRAWLRLHTGVVAPASLTIRLLSELDAVGSARWPCGAFTLRRHRGVLSCQADKPAAAPAVAPETSLCITRAGRYKLPGWGGVIVARRVQEGGTPLAWLSHLELRRRSGGEQFQAELGRPARSLKKQFQAAGLSTWERDGPLVFSGGQLMFVPGLGMDVRIFALPGQPQLCLAWAPTTTDTPLA
ncbi:MAG: hypothetical protein RLZZ618_4098 [Pseudomonadota bacterium]|jgi:tRNA(Ile)-lysidine synthase